MWELGLHLLGGQTPRVSVALSVQVLRETIALSRGDTFKKQTLVLSQSTHRTTFFPLQKALEDLFIDPFIQLAFPEHLPRAAWATLEWKE